MMSGSVKREKQRRLRRGRENNRGWKLYQASSTHHPQHQQHSHTTTTCNTEDQHTNGDGDGGDGDGGEVMRDGRPVVCTSTSPPAPACLSRVTHGLVITYNIIQRTVLMCHWLVGCCAAVSLTHDEMNSTFIRVTPSIFLTPQPCLMITHVLSRLGLANCHQTRASMISHSVSHVNPNIM
jgi:hypothetical protein